MSGIRKWFQKCFKGLSHSDSSGSKTRKVNLVTTIMNCWWKCSQMWYDKHRDRVQIREANRRARSFPQCKGQKVTIADWRAVKEDQGNLCAWCGTYYFGMFQRVDYIRALSLGGSNTRDNLQALCENCFNRRHQTLIRFCADLVHQRLMDTPS